MDASNSYQGCTIDFPATTAALATYANQGPEAKGKIWLQLVTDKESNTIKLITRDTSNFVHDNSAISTQYTALMDTLYLEMDNQKKTNKNLTILTEFLKNPVDWTKKNGQGPSLYRNNTAYEKEYGHDFVERNKTTWKTSAQRIQPREGSTEYNILPQIVDLIQSSHKNVLANLHSTVNIADITAKNIFALQKNQYTDTGNFVFYNKDTDFITFEHNKRRKNYPNDVTYVETLSLERKEPADWKFVIMFANKDSEKVWNILNKELFTDPNFACSGKIAKKNDSPQSLAQLVLYTFDDEVNTPEGVEKWEKKLTEIEKLLTENDITPLNTNEKAIKIEHPDKYRQIPGSNFIHYTLEKYKVRDREPDGPSQEIKVGKAICYYTEDGYYQMTAANYQKIPQDMRYNPASAKDPFINVHIPHER